jgi:hypothetical protein
MRRRLRVWSRTRLWGGLWVDLEGGIVLPEGGGGFLDPGATARDGPIWGKPQPSKGLDKTLTEYDSSLHEGV